MKILFLILRIPLLRVLLFLVIVIIEMIVTWFKKEYKCLDGDFRASGIPDSFEIFKDDRFVFHVRNGQIVSVIDKSIDTKQIEYKGDEHGDSE